MSNIGNLFALSPEPVVCVEDGCISYMNPPACSLFGQSLVGQPETALIPQNLASMEADSFVASVNIMGQNMTVTRSVFAETRLYSFIIPAAVQGQTSTMAVSSSMRELSNSIKATSDLITTFSQKYEDTVLIQYAAILRHASAKMKRLVNNYAIHASSLDGMPPFNPYMTSVGRICREICSELIPYANLRNVSVIYTEQEDIVASVDEGLLSQMILNVLSNSLNHVSESGKIHLELSGTKTHIIITVTDNGCGIPNNALLDVFHAYSSEVDLSSGTFTAGLGMSVIETAAKLHGGTLVIESREGEGTTVTAQLPRVVDNRLMSPKFAYQTPMHERIITELSTWLTWEDYLPED